MKLIIPLSLMFLGFFWLTPLWCQEKTGKYVASLDDQSGIVSAMREGNADLLKNKDATTPALQDLIKSAYYRTIFSIKKSSSFADKCIEDIKGKYKEHEATYTECSEIKIGNELMVNHFTKAWTPYSNVIDNIYPILKKSAGGKTVVFESFEKINLSALKNFPEFRSVPYHGGSFKIDVADGREYADIGSNLYLVEVNINGAPLTMLFDTGTQISTITQADTRKIDSNIIKSNLFGLSSYQDRANMLGYIIASKVRIGKKTFLHVTLPVTNNKLSILGLDLISQMGSSLRISKSDVTVYSEDQPNRCSHNLVVRSHNLFGLPSDFMVIHTIDGKSQQVALDTGNNGYLTEHGPAPEGGDMWITRVSGMGSKKIVYYSKRVDMSYGLGSKQVPVKLVPEFEASYQYTIGSAALRYFDFILNFKAHKGCIVKRSVI